jgi:hypothetical protein
MEEFTNLGPLTTRYNPIGSGCRSLIVLIGTAIHLSSVEVVTSTETYSIRTYGDITASGCYPPNYMTASDFQPGYGVR